MQRDRVPVGIAAVGLLTVLVGVHAELLHARSMYDFTITTGWGVVEGHQRWIHSLNHEERLLAALAGVGLLGSVAVTRWRRAAVIPALMGCVVVYYPVRAVLYYARDSHLGLYTGLPLVGDSSGRVVLGVEPYLLVVGGLLLVASGLLGWRTATRNGAASGDDAKRSLVG
jgi:hypothetical protein